MEKIISSEDLISSLLVLGFERVDPLLYSLVLGNIYFEQKEKFRFEEKEYSVQFKQFVECDEVFYKLKDGLFMDTDTGLLENKIITIEKFLSAGNRELINYLKKMDFKDVILRKKEILGITSIEEAKDLFSKKEREILTETEKKIHIMKIQPEYYDFVKNGEKIYEVRTNDSRRKAMKKGDYIKLFKEPELTDFVILEIINKIEYPNFTVLYNSLPKKEVGFEGKTTEEIVKELRKFYTEEEENSIGAVAIEVKMVKKLT